MTQRRLAELTGTQQSEVSAVLRGRPVISYDVLVRIAEGLGIPRGWMGLAFCGNPIECGTAYPDDGSTFVGEVDEDVKRRVFLAAASMALFDRPVLGELLELPVRPATPTPLPARLGAADVTALRALTRELRAVGQQFGGYTAVLTPVAQRAERLLTVPAEDGTRRDLLCALSELHSMAGWAAFDAHLDDSSRYHFSSAMRLAEEGDDHYWCSYAAYLAGVVNEERGHPDDALKLFQLAEVRLFDAAPDDQRVPGLTAWLHADSAGALINMNRPDAARCRLTQAREAWQPTNPEDAAELDFVCALVHKGLGQLDVAEQFAASAVRHRSGTPDRRAALVERITLAQLYATTGERAAAPMVQSILADVDSIRSQRVRDRLTPLANALAVRDLTCRDLAERIRQVQRV